MMAALAGVVKEDDKDIARKMFRAGDINKQVDEVNKEDYTDFNAKICRSSLLKVCNTSVLISVDCFHVSLNIIRQVKVHLCWLSVEGEWKWSSLLWRLGPISTRRMK